MKTSVRAIEGHPHLRTRESQSALRRLAHGKEAVSFPQNHKSTQNFMKTNLQNCKDLERGTPYEKIVKNLGLFEDTFWQLGRGPLISLDTC